MLFILSSSTAYSGDKPLNDDFKYSACSMKLTKQYKSNKGDSLFYKKYGVFHITNCKKNVAIYGTTNKIGQIRPPRRNYIFQFRKHGSMEWETVGVPIVHYKLSSINILLEDNKNSSAYIVIPYKILSFLELNRPKIVYTEYEYRVMINYITPYPRIVSEPFTIQ